MYSCASFFAGVGGIDRAFHNAGFTTIYANEIDSFAVSTFEENFNLKVDARDIRNVAVNELPSFDIMLAGFPCQAFSLAGYRQGFDDDKGRGALFFELERIFTSRKPKVIFLENVKNLVGHDQGKTFSVILEKLHNAGYHVKYQTMNAMTYANIPQNRDRIYIVCFTNEEQCRQFEFPNPVPLTKKISDIVAFGDKKDDKYYYKEDRCFFFSDLESAIVSQDTVYQWRRKYVRANKSNVCPTLTANMGTGGHNVPLILSDFGIRKLTPLECFGFQGFGADFILPKTMSDTNAYKQAGNSVVVPVVERIAYELKKVLCKSHNRAKGNK